ncbi:cyclin H [[Emmonsia] crescens]|uniref:Cyclin H n=1 Tax=[Emmonsia] crescens TaxID=73230 RepID=A0A2B7ZHR4_9EURO|nr:cyclin H [Emmonsia crescens]
MLEDEIYRSSSQYRLWSFTEESLRSIRANTNAVASERVRAAIRRTKKDVRHQQPAAVTPMMRSGSGTPNAAGDADDGNNGNDNNKTAEMTSNGEQTTEKEIECLTAEEELELVRYYCEKTMELGDEYKPPMPTAVRATAIQYLRRFYLTNSPMTYHPKSIMPCALFLATKTENYYMSLRSFAEHIPNSTPEDIIAPEFLLTQGLRFTFDVRHPFRSLEGGIMELNAIARGEGAPGPHHPEQVAAGLQQAIQSLPPPNPDSKPGGSITSRIAKAHHNTREILRSAAQLTDVYFLYTPSQIWLSALLLADKPLAEFYIDTKLVPPPPSSSSASVSSQASKLFTTLRAKLSRVLDSCSTTLSTYQTSHTPTTAPATMKNLKRIGRKLYHCQNPEKIDLRSLNRAAKREGSSIAATGTPAAAEAAAATGVNAAGEDEAELQRAAKKRKLERERFERDGARLFGGDLVEERKRKAGVD